MITRWQALEYVGAQNLERRALASLGTLTVVPGAIGAWRRSAIEQLARSELLGADPVERAEPAHQHEVEPAVAGRAL